ncbi:MAG TPA: amino acid ABC transporter permease [Marinobacter sp.]|uniref:Amino acid ABC transporter permease n=2 Tax=root TaxID=1 RepID=A0A831R6S9_9GAMM|nr:amino acid ABC transporter permease [Marinobacter antarcticus]HDZ39291.1 amino acid ABC transporter permease [Marinobacter sp.]HEA53284.1 amino acid ABC transporter permease [Marinobacter antarcticus]
MHEFEKHPDLPPPTSQMGVVGWLRKNLFSSIPNSIMTVIALYLLYLTIPAMVEWALINADWVGSSREACSSDGACWVFIYARINQFLYGFYPVEEQWRVNLGAAIFVVSLLLLVIRGVPGKAWIGGFTLLIFPVIAFFLFSGGIFGLEKISTSNWGGLMLTLILSTVGIVAALPFGILLALGRRSDMPIVRALCVSYIELWRGVPLITVLFMASVMLPLFLPSGVNFDKLLRALVGIALFQSAYVAEVVRGGLQAIAKGQSEAAASLGLNYRKTMALIVLPQALKVVIPGLVVTFIELFKDTTLVSIISLFDLLGIVQSALTDPSWLGFAIEGYVFAGLLYWVFCFGMSRYSMHLERRFETGHKGS